MEIGARWSRCALMPLRCRFMKDRHCTLAHSLLQSPRPPLIHALLSLCHLSVIIICPITSATGRDVYARPSSHSLMTIIAP